MRFPAICFFLGRDFLSGPPSFEGFQHTLKYATTGELLHGSLWNTWNAMSGFWITAELNEKEWTNEKIKKMMVERKCKTKEAKWEREWGKWCKAKETKWERECGKWCKVKLNRTWYGKEKIADSRSESWSYQVERMQKRWSAGRSDVPRSGREWSCWVLNAKAKDRL